MKIKKGANIQNISFHMRPVFINAEKIWKKYGQELVITSGFDGCHSAGSLHYYGLAVDLRINYFKPETRAKVFAELKVLLKNISKRYDVVWEPTHIHAEYDIYK